MFNSDLPIKGVEEDALNRSEFAKCLANTLLNHTSREGFVIGLYGKWGSGKTSVLNMIQKEIEQESKNISESPIVLRFNPWLCSNPNQLVSQFFTQLSSEIKNIPDLNDLYGLVDEYSDALELLPVIPIVGTSLSVISKILVKKSHKRKNNGGDLQKIKNKLNDIIDKKKRKIIVMIDDVDRLSNEEIISVFQLVKTIADFPYAVYLLAFDCEIIINALREVQKGDGAEYLEKIVQVPFELPEPESEDVHRIFMERLKSIIDDGDLKKWDSDLWNKMLFSIGPCLKSVRDAVRLLNLFALKYTLMRGETDVIELLGLTCIEIFEPAVYGAIPFHKKQLCGGIYAPNYQEEMNRTTDSYNILVAEVREDTRKDAVGNILTVLFPKLDSVANRHYKIGRTYNNSEALSNTRIAHISCFDRYFKLNIGRDALPKSFIDHMVFNSSEDELLKNISEVAAIKKIRPLFDQIYAKFDMYDKVSEMSDRAALIVKCLFLYGYGSEGYEGPFYMSYDMSQRRVVFKLLESINDSDRYSVIHEIFTNSDTDLAAVYDLLYTLREQQEDLPEGSDKNYPDNALLTRKEVHELEEIFVNRITSLSTDDLLTNISAIYILKMLGELDKAKYENYTRDLIAQDLSLANLICASVIHGSLLGIEQKITWNIREEELEKYIDLDTAYRRTVNFVKTDDFRTMPFDRKKNLAAFLIYVESGKKKGHIGGRYISIEDIDERLEKIEE